MDNYVENKKTHNLSRNVYTQNHSHSRILKSKESRLRPWQMTVQHIKFDMVYLRGKWLDKMGSNECKHLYVKRKAEANSSLLHQVYRLTVILKST